MRLTDTPIIDHPRLIWTLKDYDAAIEEGAIKSEHADDETAWEIADAIFDRLQGDSFKNYSRHTVRMDILLREIDKQDKEASLLAGIKYQSMFQNCTKLPNPNDTTIS